LLIGKYPFSGCSSPRRVGGLQRILSVTVRLSGGYWC